MIDIQAALRSVGHASASRRWRYIPGKVAQIWRGCAAAWHLRHNDPGEALIALSATCENALYHLPKPLAWPMYWLLLCVRHLMPPYPVDCLQCGDCCHQPPGSRIRMVFSVSPEDACRLEARYPGCIWIGSPSATYWELAVDDNDKGRGCRFFDLNQRRCSIYSERPVVCRAWLPGNSACIKVRQRADEARRRLAAAQQAPATEAP